MKSIKPTAGTSTVIATSAISPRMANIATTIADRTVISPRIRMPATVTRPFLSPATATA